MATQSLVQLKQGPLHDLVDDRRFGIRVLLDVCPLTTSEISLRLLVQLSVHGVGAVSLRLCRLGGHGGHRYLSAGEVGSPDPDHTDVDGQGEQGDPGGNQEPAGEPGGKGMAVDHCG